LKAGYEKDIITKKTNGKPFIVAVEAAILVEAK
jgi:hypothetical protein